jgi:DNA-binding response OmpR family regulator
VIFISAYKDAETLRRVSQTNFLGYLLKPFRKEELEVLINLAINKYNLSTTNNIIVINDYYSFDKNKNILFFNEQKVPLSQKEILALTLLSNNLNSYVSYELFESTVWFNSHVSDNTRRIFIHRLKNKLEKLEIKIEKNVGVGIFN